VKASIETVAVSRNAVDPLKLDLFIVEPQVGSLDEAEGEGGQEHDGLDGDQADTFQNELRHF
jgi:hypothetical protein